MLEHGELVLRPWAPARRGDPAAPTRPIRAGRGDAALGFAVRRQAAGWRFWPWSLPERFEVFETSAERTTCIFSSCLQISPATRSGSSVSSRSTVTFRYKSTLCMSL